MEDMSIVTEKELENSPYRSKKSERKPSGDDPIADWLLKHYYIFHSERMFPVRIGLCVLPFLIIFLFSALISNTTSNMIAFTSLVISLVFILISFWILCWILDKDPGSRAMQDISDSIKEGSEGFFITQYGTIFKLAFGCSICLFFLYMYRSPA